MAERLPRNIPVHPLPRPWLATVDGAPRPAPAGRVNPVDQPETLLEIEFAGLSLDEQRAALAAFPGGRRFVLVGDRTGLPPTSQA